jgi:AcrR family transcriptional regulator
MSWPDPNADATDTREAILAAAWACFRRLGLRKTTIAEIGRAAGVSRGTVYQYFHDKADIVQASAESLSQMFYRQMTLVMENGTTLADKLGLAAAFVSQARRFIEQNERFFDADEVSLLLTKNAGTLMRECVDFLAPHLQAAKVTGEVRRDLDVQAAGEWFARILFSLFSTPSSTLDMDDPEVVRCFVNEFAVRGFAPDATRGRGRSPQPGS